MNRKILIALALILGLVAAAAGGSLLWYENYRNTHIFVEDAVYPRDAEGLDLRGTGISADHYEALRAQLPDCEILWEVPFQGGYVENTAAEITVTSLTELDLALLSYLPQLQRVNAEGCRDYAQLWALMEKRPELAVSYSVTLDGEEYPHTTTGISFQTGADIAQIRENWKWLPQLEMLFFEKPDADPQELIALYEECKERLVDCSWETEFMGKRYHSETTTQIDLSGVELESFEELKAAVPYLPKLETVLMIDCGFDNETMAALREELRPYAKVVWQVNINGIRVRTDATTFMPAKHPGVELSDYQMQQLIYCEDMLCVDLGHYDVRKIDWVAGMPHLKYLIVADGPICDITPISCCKELIYAEFFDTWIADYTPLYGCTALQDLHLGRTKGSLIPLKEMTWLNNLWVNDNSATAEERRVLKESLPNTHIEFDHGWLTGGGWRELQNYFDMRDLLEMPYNSW